MTKPFQMPEMELLGQLLRARGRNLDEGFLTWEYATTPKRIRRSVDRLTRNGCRIEYDIKGIRLIDSGLSVWSDYLHHALTGDSERAIQVYKQTTSTQDLAKARADKPSLILADEQTGGRGRLGRSWHAPAGTGLLFSMTTLQPRKDQSGSVDRTSFLTAVAVAQAIEHITGHGLIQISWPNDLVVDQRKLAGILVESICTNNGDPPTLIVGVGINIGLTQKHLASMPEEVRSHATSFAMQGWSADRLYVAERVITEIDRCLHAPNIPLLVDEWRVRNLFRDQTIRLCSNGKTIQGTVIDLDPDDGLIVRRDTGEITHLHAATTTVLE